jgi:hypothetical protein
MGENFNALFDTFHFTMFMKDNLIIDGCENVHFNSSFLVVYIIWYGTWTATAKNIIQNFVTNVGTTPFWAINNAYGVGAITFKQSIDDAEYSQGKNVTWQLIWNIVENALNKDLLPKDTHGIYLVLTSRYY